MIKYMQNESRNMRDYKAFNVSSCTTQHQMYEANMNIVKIFGQKTKLDKLFKIKLIFQE